VEEGEINETSVKLAPMCHPFKTVISLPSHCQFAFIADDEVVVTIDDKEEEGGLYTLFQNDRHYSVLLFSFKLPLFTSFLNLKFERIFSLERGNKG